MQPAFTVQLRAPRANWTTHKASHNCCPPPLWVLSTGALYQVLNAAAEAVNEIIAGGGSVEAGVVIITRESGYVWGRGGPLSNLTRIPEQSVFRGRALCFFSHRSGFQRQDPPRPPHPVLQSLLSINSPRCTSTNPADLHHRVRGFLPPPFSSSHPHWNETKEGFLHFCNRKSGGSHLSHRDAKKPPKNASTPDNFFFLFLGIDFSG